MDKSRLFHAIVARSAKDRIESVRLEMLHAVLRSISDIVKEYMEPLSGDVINWFDLMQEGMAAAYDATLTYNYDKNNEHQAKWSTYIYFKVSKELSKYIAENTRLVALPRYLQDRWGPVAKAVKQLGSTNYELIAKLATRTLSESTDRKLKSHEVYTADEIEGLIHTTQNILSLDTFTNDSTVGEDQPLTYADALSFEAVPIDSEVETRILRDKIREILREKLTEEEWDILSIRWGFESGSPCGLDETTLIYKQRYPDRKMNKAKVNQTEEKVKGFLRSEENSQLRELHEATESLILERGEMV